MSIEGIHYGMPMEDYHGSSRDWLSKSAIDLILQSPRHYWHSYLKEDSSTKKSTRAQILGTHIHKRCLEFIEYSAQYLRAPDGKSRASKEYKELLQQNPGKIILPATEYDLIETIFESLMQQRVGMYLLNADGEAEVSCFFKDPHLGQRLKCRPDKLLSKRKLIIDLKTTTNASKVKFERHAKDLGYHRSVALTTRGLKTLTGEDYAYVFLVIETAPPFNIGAFEFDAASVEYGSMEIDQAILTFQECLKSKQWEGYSSKIDTISLPKWMIGG